MQKNNRIVIGARRSRALRPKGCAGQSCAQSLLAPKVNRRERCGTVAGRTIGMRLNPESRLRLTRFPLIKCASC
jgi:hypothetical protein